jgi:hypothetical protein
VRQGPGSEAGSDDEVLAEFRRVRDEMAARLRAFWQNR